MRAKKKKEDKQRARNDCIVLSKKSFEGEQESDRT